MAGVAKMIFFDDEAGDPTRPEVIERNARLAAMQDNSNLTSDGNWGKDDDR